MQIVIELDDEMYKQISTNIDVYVLDEVNFILIENAIANGTPLPKGHGRLKDENEIKQMIEDAKVENESSKKFAENIIKFAPTIIGSDKESD